MNLLHIENLSIDLKTHSGPLSIIDRLSLRMSDNEILGIVGESGSGKSMLAMAIMGLLSSKMEMKADYFSLDGQDLMKMVPADRQAYISSKASIIFQDPKSSLNPCFTIATQLNETLSAHGLHARSARKQRSMELLDAVGINQTKKVLNLYPHQLSGGMNQRVAIAIALACKPRLLIADEPTTSLDVTIQAQILDLIVNLNKTENVGVVLITHDFALLSENTDKIGVFYSGHMMEHAATKNILTNPLHPYTRSLLNSVPQLGKRHTRGSRLFALKGQIPTIDKPPVGCRLGPRCPSAEKQCVKPPRLISIPNHGKVRCHFAKQENERKETESNVETRSTRKQTILGADS
ncbi:MAG: ABC transporter ATP-binding protein [Kangiellaceae bacterium]|nr:ABC transporter ATP-binding protein [Kangiellaceae bacterium]